MTSPSAVLVAACPASPGGVAADSLSKEQLVHELLVHQAELEQQNEELRRAQGELAGARDRFVDLFDHAPVGYLTLDRAGSIIEANLTIASELGVDRQALLGQRLARFIAVADGDRWQRLQRAAWRGHDKRVIELAMRCPDGRAFHAQLSCLGVDRPGTAARLRVTVTDISVRKLAETNFRLAIGHSDAREADRHDVAFRLHEDLAQRLSALKMNLALIGDPLAAKSVPAVVASMDKSIDEVLDVVRQMATRLHPLILDNLGLQAALDSLAHDAALRQRIEVAFHVELDDRALPRPCAIAIYRLAETALQHLARNAGCVAAVDVLRRPSDVVLQFRLEVGRAPPAAPATADDASSLGAVLKDQLHLLGGRLELCDSPEGRPQVTVFLPLPAG